MIKLLIHNSYSLLEEMHRQLTYLLLFLLFFLQTMFFVYIRDGRYSLVDYLNFETWVLTMTISFIFTGLGSFIFLGLTKKTNLPWRARMGMAFGFPLVIMAVLFSCISYFQ